MSEKAIVVEKLSKRYLIGHFSSRSPGQFKYTALRDVIGRKIGNFTRKAADVARGRQVLQGEAVEEFWALKDVSFEVKQGEVLGIIGRNGAGKSTLLKILSRITEPTSGRVALLGRVASLLEVGTGFHPELTGRENIFLNGAILGMMQREIRTKFDEIVAFAEVERFLDTPVKHYSSGMYVRLAFAVAAHLEPEILIVDEVLAVGDMEFQRKCLGKMQDVSAKHGRTVLFVSHNMAAVQQLCGRALLLRNGSITDEGDSKSVISSYLSGVDYAGSVSLRNWKHRVGNNDGMIVNFEMRDRQGSHVNSVLMGDKVVFILTIELNRPIAGAQCGIYVHTAAGEAVLELRSSHDNLYITSSSVRIIAEVAVDNLELYPGEYTLSPWICDRGYTVNIDWVQHCCRLRVFPGARGSLGLDSQFGKYFVPSSWSVRNDGEAPDLISVPSQDASLRNT